MLRHFKMELKRQQERENQSEPTNNLLQQVAQHHQLDLAQTRQARPLATADVQAINLKTIEPRRADEAKKMNKLKSIEAKRVRGRRSSKPAMEKRRRARINECLDILKSYVLNDTGNLNRLGIDLSACAENRLDEDSIAREILKTSGLINRHRGRKNPNKLEKADILELTVDYVTRLHKQRDELLVTAVLAPQHQHQRQHQQQHQQTIGCYQQQQIIYGDQLGQVPAHLNEPLTLDLSPKSRLSPSTTPPTLQAYRPPPNTPLTPPSSGSSNSGQIVTYQQAAQQASQIQLLGQVLTDGRYKLQDYVTFTQAQQ